MEIIKYIAITILVSGFQIFMYIHIYNLGIHEGQESSKLRIKKLIAENTKLKRENKHLKCKNTIHRYMR